MSSFDGFQQEQDEFQFARSASANEAPPDEQGEKSVSRDNVLQSLEAAAASTKTATAREGIRSRWKQIDGTNKLRALGTTLQKANPAKWIDNLEKDQNLADSLEDINQENQQDLERREMMREAASACMDAIIQHLHEYLQGNPQGTYEGWIEELHPENAEEGKLLDGLDRTVDHRFYVEESDHRRLWNENLTLFLDNDEPTRRFVPPRSQIGANNTKSIEELLTMGTNDGGQVESENEKQDVQDVFEDTDMPASIVTAAAGAPKTDDKNEDDNLLVFD